jgi:TRAP-type C4-dicarboxylate transport system permease small subunit
MTPRLGDSLDDGEEYCAETSVDRALSYAASVLSVFMVGLNTVVWWGWYWSNLSYVPYGHSAELELTAACIVFPPLLGAAVYVLRYLQGIAARTDRLVDALIAALFASIPPLLVAVPLHGI